MTSGVSVRTLASPGFVLALVLLALNDHVLKPAYPGVVTGKLSDVAGLVVAPLVLGVLLTAWRVRRPMPVAIALTALGFALTKTTAAGAAVVSALWSLGGVPTHIDADLTDLVALPALYAAWLVHRQVAARPPVGWRPVVARATGVALLPVAVLVSAATSCGDDEGLTSLTVVNARFPGGQPGREDRLVASWPGLLDGRGRFSRLASSAFDVSGEDGEFDDRTACDEDGTCWRIDPTVDFVPSVQISTDGGRTWYRDLWVTPDDRDASLVGEEESCGDPPSARLRAIRVLRGGTTIKVAVAASRAGVYVRTTGGEWSLLDDDELSAPDTAPTVEPRGRMFAVTPIQPQHQPPTEETPYPGEEESLPPEPTCEAPVTVSATPDPRNGPPTVYTSCP